jgi:hypothetical protein
MWILLPYLDEPFPDYEQAWATVRSVLSADKDATVVLRVCRSTAASAHIYEALQEFGTDSNFSIGVNARLHRAYEEQRVPEKRLELRISNVVRGEEE